MELTGRPPVHACLNIRLFIILMFFSNTVKCLFVIIWLLYFILGRLSKWWNAIRNVYKSVCVWPTLDRRPGSGWGGRNYIEGRYTQAGGCGQNKHLTGVANWVNWIDFKTGVYKVIYNLIFFTNPIFLKSWFSFPKFYVHFPYSPLDILSNSLNIIGKIILLPLSLFSTLYSSPQPWYSLPLFATLNSSQTDLINSPPPPGGE